MQLSDTSKRNGVPLVLTGQGEYHEVYDPVPLQIRVVIVVIGALAMALVFAAGLAVGALLF